MIARRAAVEKVKKVAELVKRDDVSGAIEFVERRQYNFLNRPGCARIDPLHRTNLSICSECGNFDRLNLICKVGAGYGGRRRS